VILEAVIAFNRDLARSDVEHYVSEAATIVSYLSGTKASNRSRRRVVP